jgi:hypothetical protein
MKSKAYICGLAFLLLSFLGSASFAQNANCGDAPVVEDGTIKGALDGKAELLMRFIGNAQLKGEVDVARSDVLSRYPNASALRINQYFLYVVCMAIFQDKAMSTLDKINAFTKARNSIFSSEPTTTPASTGNAAIERLFANKPERPVSILRMGFECCYGVPRGNHLIELYDCITEQSAVACLLKLQRLDAGSVDYEVGKDNFWANKFVDSDHDDHPQTRGYFISGQRQERQKVNLSQGDSVYLGLEYGPVSNPVVGGRIVIPHYGYQLDWGKR